ncbi:DUF3466 family protein [Vibrio agarivorans]|uniref:DUF3466 family protein n=1 Tax=Vibrio agarivorans TaxID=153622 RepID=UPI0025B5EB46|nr:DUF3466 family protein [Vibrio agarivorans]MDN3663313.1 DUF3466 family protein [Vibrio agarivorans]
MSSTKFKLSVVTTALLSAFAAKAETVIQPMYNVVPVEVPNDLQNSYDSADVFGVAIQASSSTDINNMGNLGCFVSEDFSILCNDYAAAGEIKNSVEGWSIREEVPFAMDASFGYIEDYDSFKSYCYRERLYSTCESWASEYWNAWRDDVNGESSLINLAFIEGDSSEYVNTGHNNAINSLDQMGIPIGIQSNSAANSVSTPRRDIQSVPTLPAPENEDELATETRAWSKYISEEGTVYISGSSAFEASSNTNGNFFNSQGTLWRSIDGGKTFEVFEVASWGSGKSKDGERLAQGNIFDLVEIDGKLYGVGYNTQDSNNNYYEATVFEYNDDGDFVGTKLVSGARAKNSDGDVVHSNTQLVSVNDNGIAIGEAKLYGSRPQNGAAANKPFVVEDITSDGLSATFLQNYGQSIFFDGVGAELGSINNFNELVGSIDATQARENDGQPRRRRGFIYTVPAETSSRASLYRNSAWLLDDLTNSGDPNSENNNYRIISATDINDAGVISATAIYCPDGYDDTTHNSYCGNRQVDEQVVAVKLVPNPASLETEDGTPTINPRGVNDPPVERQGAGFGWLFLAALGFLGFRRK